MRSRGVPGRVLVLRPDNIGDAVLFSGALPHLRSLYPSAKISLCVRERVRGLVELCPHVDEIISWESLVPNWSRIDWRLRGHPQARFLLREARAALLPSRAGRRWDRVIVPVRSPSEEVLWFVRHSGIPESVGIAGCDANCRDSRYRPEGVYARRMDLSPERFGPHEMETTRRFLSFLAGRELSPGDVRPAFWTAEEDRRFAESVLPGGEGPSGGALALVPGAAAPYREWALPHFAEVVRGLPDPGAVVILGGKADAGKAKRLAALLEAEGQRRPVTVLAGKTTLRQLVEVVRRCRLLVGAETAALHVAAALGVPAVGILGGGHYGRFYPWGDPAVHRAAASPMECFGCGWQCVFGDFRCIPAVEPRRVLEEARAALAGSGTSRTRPVW
jgi:ADP-heptose:LPS heptosyltransferase